MNERFTLQALVNCNEINRSRKYINIHEMHMSEIGKRDTFSILSKR